MKKIIIAGGAGFLGNTLTQHFKSKAEEIVILTRGKTVKRNNVQYLTWDAQTLSGWEKQLDGADVLINLTGKSVDCRYTQKNKEEILLSRVRSTQVLNEGIDTCANPPKVWLNSSTATIYRHSEDKEMDEFEGEIGFDFSMNVAKAWERAFFETSNPAVRKVALRTAIVLGKKGGAFSPLKSLAKIGFGGTQGSGQQFVSWIHEHDFCRAVEFIINNNSIDGVINIVAPKPIVNREFMKTLRKSLNMPFGIPLSASLLSIGARIIRTETELVLKSRRVIPKRLKETGFEFVFPKLKSTLENLA